MKKLDKIKCNYCGSSKFDKRKEDQTKSEPFGEKIKFKKEIWICKKCGDEINYTLNYTDEYEESQKQSEVSSIKNILDFFNKRKVKLKDIEDSLELPIRTLSRWKSSLNYSKVGLALLRVIRSYPWIIYVAARRFDNKVVNEVFKQAAIKKFNLTEKPVISKSINASAWVLASENSETYEPERKHPMPVIYNIENDFQPRR
ncbi:MAG: hypothetical protein PF487_06820 [Bacteroidales bacterium]|jgi:transposase-like protein|nr:hypothetical protein [Bacteroidales bacterium]